MKHILAFGLMGLIAVNAGAEGLKLSEEFDDFDVPAGFTVLNYDNLGINTAHFAPSLPPQPIWYHCDRGLTRHKGVLDDFSPLLGRTALLSVSHRDDPSLPTDNWLITPEIEISEGDCLTWEAKSVHYLLRENYSVLISTGGEDKEDFTELISVEEESYVWKRHTVDLSEYAGKRVRIAFAHTSQHKFLLALDYVRVGTSEVAELTAENIGSHYFGAEDLPVLTFSVSNHGAPSVLKQFAVRRADTEQIVGVLDMSADEIGALETRRIEIPVALDIDAPYQYELIAVQADGTEKELLSDFANRSAYRRRMLIEKFTGVWCNSCPHVVYPYHISSFQLGEEAIPVEIHSAGPGATDKDALTIYGSPTVYPVNGDYPALWYNRSVQQTTYKPQDRSFFDKAALLPTVADIEMTLEPAVGDSVAVRARVRFAEDIDNSDDHIALQFTLVEHETPSHIASGEQQWSSPGSLLAHGEFYFMGTTVPKDLNPLENVARSTTSHMSGQAGLLPAELKAGEEYEVIVPLAVPAAVIEEDDMFVVGSVIDASTRTYEVMNANTVAAPAELFAMEPAPEEDPEFPDDTPSGLTQMGADAIRAVREGNLLRIEGCEDGVASVYDVCGVLMATSTIKGECVLNVPGKGILILRVTTPGGVATRKIQ